jgi:hypothetical protein
MGDAVQRSLCGVGTAAAQKANPADKRWQTQENVRPDGHDAAHAVNQLL